ncbi:hypothetical protein [Pseudalkalibacillus hwajinpoensis]|uniref:XRE family transcriptional regulator n=1 Tax=Guptibacillus hwajinpoensis TaxID=208199 RepID=A0A4U1MD22_9BACL|nr:hypothetical protein [Pseudalkalibacillus hwajinpoensis]TKD68232.1 hypothetical protein FBF83_16950 [Pseudalkalibacillus hwajinpoensis]
MLSNKTLLELKIYINNFLEPPLMNSYESAPHFDQEQVEHTFEDELTTYITTHSKPPFRYELLQMIDHRGFTDIEIYKKAGIDRKHFSKIRSNPSYRIGKKPAIALALALQLDLEETDQLLSSAGFSLSESDPFDLVIQFCIDKKIYDLDDVNEALESVGVRTFL